MQTVVVGVGDQVVARLNHIDCAEGSMMRIIEVGEVRVGGVRTDGGV